MTSLPPWHFPVPVRRSRFVAASPQWGAFNVEVALDRIAPFAIARRRVEPVLYFDYQTQIEENTPGRHGTGRGGVFRGYYVKGVGRTLAAANWNDLRDRYHGSGHLSVASALRERLITAALKARGLGDAIVPCENVLIGRLRPDERRAVALGESSSQTSLTPADASLMALSLKPADFARASNLVWAIDHFSMHTDRMGSLFLDFERYLKPPDRRENLSGEPASIARALDAAFRRGVANMQRYERVGLFWIYTHNNYTLDGRWVDLETPLFFGAPFVGVFQQERSEPSPYIFLGLECFSFVACWRLWLRRLLGNLRYLTSPLVLETPPLRSFLREMARQIRAVFSPQHLIYRDSLLQQQAVANLASAMDLGRRGRAGLAEFAGAAFARTVNGIVQPPPDLGWREIAVRPAPISATPFQITAPSFLKPALAPDGEMFAGALEHLGALRDPQQLLAALAKRAGSFATQSE